MRISSKTFFKKIKVIETRKSFARIANVNDNEIVYSISYLADIPSSIKNKVSIVKISAYPDSPIVKSSMFGGSVTASESIKNIRNYSSRIKDRLKEARSDMLVFKNSDISTGINNEVAKRISANPQQAEALLGYRTVYTYIRNSQNPNSKESPILSVQKIDQENDTDTRKNLKSLATYSILKNGIDPSSIAEATFPINSHVFSMQGLTRYGKANRKYYPHRQPSSLRFTQRDHRDMQHSRLNRLQKLYKESRSLRAALRTNRNSEPILSSRIIRRKIRNTFVTITEDITFPRSVIKKGGNIHFLFELYNADNAIIDVLHKVVNHDELLQDYFTPDYPPKIFSNAIGLGQNVIRLHQIDRTANRIELYRKILSPSDSVPAGKYKLVDTIDATRDMGLVRIIDRVNNTKNCIYMAIAVGPSGKRSRRFRRDVCSPFKTPHVPKKIVQEYSHISIFAENEQDHVSIRICNIPDGPVSAYVTALDLSSKNTTRNKALEKRVVGKTPEEQMILLNKSVPEIEFFDYEVKDGHIYEYKCMLVYANGKIEESKISEIHRFKKEKVDAERVSVDLGELQVYSDDDNSLTIVFNISGALTSPGIDMVVDALSSAGIDSDFIDEINSNKENYSSVLAYSILRQDEISGKTEDMGISLGGIFSDDPQTRESRGVSDLMPGRSYRYIVRAILRSPETLLLNSAFQSLDIETSKTFTKLVSKYYNPYTLSSGTLPSTAAVNGYNTSSKISSRDVFSQGLIGVEKSIDAVIPSQVCKVLSATCSRTADDKNVISWLTTGNLDEVDHFLIMASYQGVKSTIAAVHNLSDSGEYSVVDLELSDEVGEVSYSVLPVYSNYSYGSEVFANTAVNEVSEPIFKVKT